ncbi:MAG TPA: hypothetical protein VJP40_07845 [bacterium]|nr:hypothetical protein [bacterium]
MLFLAALAACSGGAGGPMGGSGPVGGSLDSGGNYAAGPVSLPSPSTLNKNLIVCENVAGPRVECRGSDGAASPNAHIKLTVYSRFSAIQKSWTDYLIPSAQALVGNTDFCDANATGAFGASGDCSVVAASGEKIGICEAKADNTCGGPELVITVPVEGGTSSGSSGIIKSLSVDPDGNIIFGRRSKPAGRSFSLLSLFWGTAQAQPVEAPLLTPPAATGSSCPSASDFIGNPASAYQAPADQTVTLKSRVAGSEVVTELFRLAGRQEDLKAVHVGNIGNLRIYAVALQNTVYLVARDGLNLFARIVFPAPVRSFDITTEFSVLLDVPKGKPSRFKIAPDTFVTECDPEGISRALSNPNSFATGMGHYTPPGEGYRVPQSIWVNAVAGLYASDQVHQVYMHHNGFGVAPDDIYNAWEGVIYQQAAPVKDVQVLSVNDYRAVVAVLDYEANRLVFITHIFPGGENQVTNFSLAGLVEVPVAMALLSEYGSMPKLLVLDSGENKSKGLSFPLTISEDGVVTVNTASAKVKDLGAIVVKDLERGEHRTGDWITYDLITSNVVKFNPSEFVALAL